MSETDLQRSIVSALRTAGAWVIRINSGKARFNTRLAEAGTPDLHLVGLGWLEVKAVGGRLSSDQLAWHNKARSRGVRVCVVTSATEAVAIYQGWKAEIGDTE